MATSATKSQQQVSTSGVGSSTGEKTMRKPVFVKVSELRPGTSGHNLTVKVVSSTTVLDKKSRNSNSFSHSGAVPAHTRIAECLIGDDTATILFTARNDQGITVMEWIECLFFLCSVASIAKE
ncbi:hypothetical protein OROMI_015996 [Orobanche minor]